MNNKRFALSICWVFIGIILMVLSITEILNSSIYSGMGGGLIAVGALQVARNVKYRKNEEYREKVDIEITDERNKLLRMKSWSITGYAMVLVLAVGSVVAFFLGNELIQKLCLLSVCLMVCIYWVTYVILNKKY